MPGDVRRGRAIALLLCAMLLVATGSCRRGYPRELPEEPPERTVIAAPTHAPTVAPPTPAPPATASVPSAGPAASPTPALPGPFQAALQALVAAGSFRAGVEVAVPFPGSQTRFRVTREDEDVVVTPPASWHAVQTFDEGIRQETISIEGKGWTRVGVHPWVTLQYASNSFLETYVALHQAAVVTATEMVTAAGQMVVHWHAAVGADPANRYSWSGTTWLQAGTSLLQREAVRYYDPTGALYMRTDAIYKDYGAPLTIAAPEQPEPTAQPLVLPTSVPGITVRQETCPMPGDLYVPEGPGPWPALVLLHGSEGGALGLMDSLAAELAKEGYVTLALCYFGCPNTPTTLRDVDVETVIGAVDYLKGRADVRPGAIGIVGGSRGAELALIVGTLDPDVHAVASLAGSPEVYGAYPARGVAWLYQGEPLPFLTIPVEKIAGPVFIAHGEEDETWPVTYAYHIADRLVLHGHAYELMINPHDSHQDTFRNRTVVYRLLIFLDRALRGQ